MCAGAQWVNLWPAFSRPSLNVLYVPFSPQMTAGTSALAADLETYIRQTQESRGQQITVLKQVSTRRLLTALTTTLVVADTA